MRVSSAPSGRVLALGVLALALAALFVRLGIWQLQRAEQRSAFNRHVRLALEQPPVDLEPAMTSGASPRSRLAYRRAVAAGHYDPARQVVVKGRTWKGAPGIELLQALVLEGGGEVWVNRGWVPSPDAATIDPARFEERGPVRVSGFLRPPTPQERRDLSKVGFVLEQLPDRSLSRPPVRRGEPELSGGPHIFYAVQWFAFAAIAVVGYAAYAWSRSRSRAPLVEAEMQEAE
jgi:surfeit locus 1 family protein